MGEPINVFISYSHDSREHSARVLALADQLRQDGLNANIDRYEVSPPEGWPHWMDRQIREADFVIVVCTETYLKRTEGREQPGRGLGVRWESLLTYTDLYNAGSQNHKYIPVSFEDDEAFIPRPLRGATRYVLSSPEGYEELRRRLYGESAAVRPPLGPRRSLEPRSADPAFFTPKRNNFIEIGLAPSARFVGREEDLQHLHDQLKQGDGLLAHALSGEGGVGKTQLAIAYVHRYADEYEGIWWVDASREALTSSVTKLAALLKIETQRVSPEEIRTRLCHALSQGRHLLILDNVERLEDGTAFTLQAPSQVLMTTRLARLPHGRVTTLHVDVLERESSIQMLRSARSTWPSPEDAQLLANVAEHLGYHPLALDFAAEYLRKYPDVTPQELLESLHRTEVGDIESPLEDTEPEEIGLGYRFKVAKSIGLHLPSFEGTLGEWLLELLAFCHPDDIPVELLVAAAQAPTEEVRRSLRKLTDVSIIRYEQSISLHRLTQSVIRARLDTAKTRATLSRLVSVLRVNFGDPEDHRSWPMQDVAAPHALAVLEMLRKKGLDEPPGMGLVLSRYFNIRSRLEEAIWALGALQSDGQLVDPSRINDSAQSNSIGSVLFSWDYLDEALSFFRRAEHLLHVQQDPPRGTGHCSQQHWRHLSKAPRVWTRS